MNVTEVTKSRLAKRREHRDRLANGWEYVNCNGGNLWELDRGYRSGWVITDVDIADNRVGLWVKTKPDDRHRQRRMS